MYWLCRYAEKVIHDAKREARSELSISRGDWRRRRAAASDVTDPAVLDSIPAAEHVPRVHANDLSAEQFVQQYEGPKKPVIIEGLLDGWPASTAWQPARLLQRFSDHRFKVGSDDDGYPVRMKLKHYLLYLLHPEHSLDDSPLYIFDGTFTEKKYAPELKKVQSLSRWRGALWALLEVPRPVAASMQQQSVS